MTGHHWRSRLARISLGLAALGFGAFGLYFLARPEAMGSMIVFEEQASVRIEIRGMYGGLELGLGVFFGAAALRRDWFRPGLFAQMATLGGLAGGRILGMIAESEAPVSLVFFTALELGGAALGLAAYFALFGESGASRTAPPG